MGQGTGGVGTAASLGLGKFCLRILTSLVPCAWSMFWIIRRLQMRKCHAREIQHADSRVPCGQWFPLRCRSKVASNAPVPPAPVPPAPSPAAAAPAATLVAAPTQTSTFLTFGRLFHAYHLSILDLLVVASVIILGRFIVLLVEHNEDGWKKLDKSALPSAAVLTLKLSVPFFIFVALLSFFWSQVEKQAEVHTIELLTPPGQPQPKSLEEALRQASAREQQKVAAKSTASVNDAAKKANEATTELVSSVMPNVRNSFPPYLMELKSCGFFDIFCHVINGIKSVVNSVYRKARDAALNSLEAELRRADSYAKSELEQKRRVANDAVSKFSRESTSWADIAIVKSFETIGWVGLILSIYGFLVIAKTLMVILSRILYQDGRKNKNYASLRPNQKFNVQSEPNILGNEFEVSSKSPNYFVALSYEIRNAVANVACPQPLSGIPARIASGRYVLGQLLTANITTGAASIGNKSGRRKCKSLLVPTTELFTPKSSEASS